ncbi:MAG: GNAT family N-acetyltransferase [Candidatus Marsarchaeota archaeon]|nr:GNAT family N-acetyltransferase [Candidatus Marsarchaeota archaeon]MCL5413096.1 GNAT family N-acetyltransferase [Candidatus Marsarchaeota archaeon]
METKIRKYEERDFVRIAEVYKSAFAEQPWNEFMKCKRCEVNYGKDEVRRGYGYSSIGARLEYVEPKTENRECKKCGVSLSARVRQTQGGAYVLTNKDFTEFWSESDVKKDLSFAEAQSNPIILVAESQGILVGFTWGYSIPLAEFPFLAAKVGEGSVYMDEIAVDPSFRRSGIGKQLCHSFVESASSLAGAGLVVLRTDENNAASMSMFRSLEFESLGVYDPKFESRLYLKREIRD